MASCNAGSRGAVEQAAAANELQQLLAKRLAGNVQRQACERPSLYITTPQQTYASCVLHSLPGMQVPTVASSMLLRSFNAIRTKSYGVAAYKGPDRSSLTLTACVYHACAGTVPQYAACVPYPEAPKGRPFLDPGLTTCRARSQVSTPFRVTLGTPVSCAQQCIQHVRSRT
eukprot:1154236-Pelagomonas_calceolata.AAC.10